MQQLPPGVPIGDELAGRPMRCKFCGEETRVAPRPPDAGPGRRARATMSLHGPDLTALANLEPSSPTTPQYAMDYIAPPPKAPPRSARRGGDGPVSRFRSRSRCRAHRRAAAASRGAGVRPADAADHAERQLIHRLQLRRADAPERG